jgi:hypothetical protein
MNSRPLQQATAGTLTWLPLVARPRPPCLPLPARIAELTHRAAISAQPAGRDRVSRAAEVLNKAALIASDCGLPGTARALCHRQYELFDQARPLPAWAAPLALQPLLNIPRQLIRQGQGQAAYDMLESLGRAAREQSVTVIDGQPVNLAALTAAPDGHQAVRALVWTTLLADGTRALAVAGRWQEAARHAAAHRGIGKRLLDGRQATILAHLECGHADTAVALVARSAVTEPWEHALQALLRVLCMDTAGAGAGHHVVAMLGTAGDLARDPDRTTTVSRARIGMLALDLAWPSNELLSQSLRASLITSASYDGHTAQDVLSHYQVGPYLTTGQRQHLQDLVQSCGLGVGSMPEQLHEKLMAAVHRAETTVKTELT